MYVAVYAWRVKPGKEAQFREAWRRGTRAITQLYGSFGSRLHQAEDGRFIGYAEWPDEETWRKAFDAKMVYDDPEARAAFMDALEDDSRPGEMIGNMLVTDDLLTTHPTRG
ncbi:antibiotic biosynthesis monooxygenase [Caulobacter sp. SLTY]|uniref:antibiotic biosynthesis monooxygenase family protein n=1 Tax=Caulobacter sp. SLTY TaxID=2683262 RepID=UPI001413758B|nr:antibiotic biosynthesis monooxygenase [Caulobacter sp. SLTY]NBB16354.1 antibiotic biosynthesis monooxygenase [Caulobacter sp. SLTY]